MWTFLNVLHNLFEIVEILVIIFASFQEKFLIYTIKEYLRW